MRLKSRKVLLTCWISSLTLHVLALIFFQRYSVWFSSPEKGETPATYLSLVDRKERDQILRTAFEPQAKEEPAQAKELKPLTELASAQPMQNPVQVPEYEFLKSILFQELPTSSELIAAHRFLPSFAIPSESFDLLKHLPKELIIPTATSPSLPHFHPQPDHPVISMNVQAPIIREEVPAAPIAYNEPIELSQSDIPIAGKPPSPIPLPSLPTLPTLAELETSSYSDAFDAEIVFLPKEEGEGYIFALTLIPQHDLQLPKIRQHFTFLIDRSNSIQQGRLTATKAAVHKALEDLLPEDTFNIVAFDSKVEKMAPNYLPRSAKSLAIAEEFLEKIQLGSFFSSSDLYKPLLVAVPGTVENDEVYTAILLTDAETLAKKNVQRALLHDWTRYNSGRISLFAIGINGDAQASGLEVATAFNKGKLLTAPTNRGLKRKLLKLIKTIHSPVAKNLSCKAISRSPQAKIRLFPKTAQMPNLYLDQPYVILGETDSLDDFILFVQGRLKDRWLNVKKTVSFLNAKKGNKSLKQEWAFTQANQLYERFVQDENPKHIAEIETLLAPFEQIPAFR